MAGNQYVVKRGDKWAVVSENSKRASAIVNTQREAVKIARDRAIRNGSELRVQDRNGKWRSCNSYGNDPCPPKDKNR